MLTLNVYNAIWAIAYLLVGCCIMLLCNERLRTLSRFELVSGTLIWPVLLVAFLYGLARAYWKREP